MYTINMHNKKLRYHCKGQEIYTYVANYLLQTFASKAHNNFQDVFSTIIGFVTLNHLLFIGDGAKFDIRTFSRWFFMVSHIFTNQVFLGSISLLFVNK